MIRIFQASRNDIETIRQVAFNTWPSTFGSILSQEQINYMLDMMYSIESLTSQMIAKKHIFLLAFNDEKCVGFISYELDYKKQAITKIHKIYVLPKTQGNGVGKLLLSEVKRIAIENNNTALSLNVNRENPAIEFYKKLGFVIAGNEDIDIGNGFLMEDYIMEYSF